MLVLVYKRKAFLGIILIGRGSSGLHGIISFHGRLSVTLLGHLNFLGHFLILRVLLSSLILIFYGCLQFWCNKYWALFEMQNLQSKMRVEVNTGMWWRRCFNISHVYCWLLEMFREGLSYLRGFDMKRGGGKKSAKKNFFFYKVKFLKFFDVRADLVQNRSVGKKL